MINQDFVKHKHLSTLTQIYASEFYVIPCEYKWACLTWSAPLDCENQDRLVSPLSVVVPSEILPSTTYKLRISGMEEGWTIKLTV